MSSMVTIVITVDTDGDPKETVRWANENLPTEYNDIGYAIDGQAVDEEGDAL